MKKSLVLVLTLALSVGAASSALAASPTISNPFTDVPKTNWAYQSVTKLAHEGIIDGFSNGTFQGEHNVTRYEMAQMVAHALAHYDAADAIQKQEIDKLAVEFKTELGEMGVRLKNVEGQVDNLANRVDMKVGGDLRIRYLGNAGNMPFSNVADAPTGWSTNQKPAKTRNWQYRVRVNISGDVNDNVSWFLQPGLQNTQSSTAGTFTGSEMRLSQGYMTVKNALSTGAEVKIGRMPLAFGVTDMVLNIGGFIDGVQATRSFGKLDARFGAVDLGPGASEGYGALSGVAKNQENVWYNTMTYNFDKDNMITTTYINGTDSQYHYDNNYGATTVANGVTMDNYLYAVWAVGAKATLAPNVVFYGDYAKNHNSALSSVASDQKQAYYGRLQYKGADPMVPQSFGVWVDYRKIGAFGSDPRLTGFDLPRNTYVGYDANGNFVYDGGYKGVGLGFNYTLSKKVWATFQVTQAKDFSGHKFDKEYMFKTEMMF